VFRRYRRWIKSGVLASMLETLTELASHDRQVHMVDIQQWLLGFVQKPKIGAL
jgi:hypothetical protein